MSGMTISRCFLELCTENAEPVKWAAARVTVRLLQDTVSNTEFICKFHLSEAYPELHARVQAFYIDGTWEEFETMTQELKAIQKRGK